MEADRTIYLKEHHLHHALALQQQRMRVVAGAGARDENGKSGPTLTTHSVQLLQRRSKRLIHSFDFERSQGSPLDAVQVNTRSTYKLCCSKDPNCIRAFKRMTLRQLNIRLLGGILFIVFGNSCHLFECFVGGIFPNVGRQRFWHKEEIEQGGNGRHKSQNDERRSVPHVLRDGLAKIARYSATDRHGGRRHAEGHAETASAAGNVRRNEDIHGTKDSGTDTVEDLSGQGDHLEPEGTGDTSGLEAVLGGG